MGDRQLPHADHGIDHHCFLLPSVDDQRDVLLQNRADHFGEGRRVYEIYSGLSAHVEKGAPIFRLDSSQQQASVELSRRRIARPTPRCRCADRDIQAADAQIEQAKSAHQQALEELQTKEELNRRNADIVARREMSDCKTSSMAAKPRSTRPARRSRPLRPSSRLLPAQKASAEAALAEAQVELDETVVRAGVTGRVEQFALQVGDIVNPVLRPAGILIPDGAGRGTLVAGFGQIEAQVLRAGLVAEVTCGPSRGGLFRWSLSGCRTTSPQVSSAAASNCSRPKRWPARGQS